MEVCGLIPDLEFERAFKLWDVIGVDDELDGAGLAGDALDKAALDEFVTESELAQGPSFGLLGCCRSQSWAVMAGAKDGCLLVIGVAHRTAIMLIGSGAGNKVKSGFW